ncbi:PAS domain-containing hybrid sensor histidine kinase/response regulator [Neogemmobacter tilapiae]|uniref:PAS domain-containing hybrid sensor histidine kinase/response regulator n=1 Tax=Neogemmobacter tilapiae TaxID=875041 RepID=UPI001679D420|nr:PAS domain-containing hybrid sensor histidine kinase/response regulator [Gemmobacter tilapiae]
MLNPQSTQPLLNVLIASLVALAILLCAFAISYLSSDVRREIDDLARANADNTQWSLAQNELELLAMINAGRRSMASGEGLDAFRERFDIFYSRARMLQESSQFRELRRSPDVMASIAYTQNFLDRQVVLVDGNDSDLQAALPDIVAEAEGLQARLRAMSLLGIRIFSATADERRMIASETLLWIALLTAALVLALTMMVMVLTFMTRQAHRRANEQSATRARLEAIISTALDGVIVIDRDGVILDYNAAAQGIFGYARAEVIGQVMADLMIPDHLKAAHAAGMRRFDVTRDSRIVGKARVQMEGRRKNGEVFPIEFSVSVASSAEGEIFVSFLRDISARLAAEQELVNARDKAVQGEKAKADFLAVMSHEMRTPLNGMLGTLELLQSTRLDDSQKRYVQVIASSGQLLLHHVNDVLDISRLDAGKMELQADHFNANALVQEIVENQGHLALTKGNRLHWSPEDDSLNAVRGDAKRLRQVLLNLVGNAVKFTRNGDVTILAKRLPGGLAEFRVIDTGIGIPKADQPRIFEDFVTIDASYMRSAGGTGLGLGIAQRLVRAMGGQIGVESEAGQGSLFWVRLPLAEDVLSPSNDGKAGLGRGRRRKPWAGRRILVVEDNHINRFVVREMLQREGCLVDEAHDGEEGVALARRQSYDLILMDISMPDVDGLAAARRIQADAKGASQQAPIVALTAHALPQDMERFRAAGLAQTLIKPISIRRLQGLLQSTFAQIEAWSVAAEPQEPLVRDDTLDQLRQSLGEAKFRELLGQFLSQTDSDMARLIESTDDPLAMAAMAHRMAGSAAVFGAGVLHEVLERLEQRLKTGPAKALRDDLVQARACWAETRSRLQLSGSTAKG